MARPKMIRQGVVALARSRNGGVPSMEEVHDGLRSEKEARGDLHSKLVDISGLNLDAVAALPPGVLSEALRRIAEDGGTDSLWVAFQDGPG